MTQRRKLLLCLRDAVLLSAAPAAAQAACPRLVPGALPAILRLQDAGYECVLLLPTPDHGTACAHDTWLLELLHSQGVVSEALALTSSCAAVSVSLPVEDLARLNGRLQRHGERACAVLVGAGDASEALGVALGVPVHRVHGEAGWGAIAHELADAPRRATVERNTRETRIRVAVDLDSEAQASIATGIGFFDHMLDQLGRHGGFALELACQGDTQVDEHHTVEDCALALGEALRAALGDKRGIARYGATLPMDEARAEALLDLSGRPYFVFEGRFTREQVGGLPTELVPHFFQSLSQALGATLHLRVQGENAHHQVEACFKSVARALRQALRREGRELPSTKGSL